MALHYGLQINVAGGSGYSFDKHWAQGFDPGGCPPWRLPPSYNASVELAGGLFPHPPPASSFKTKVRHRLCGMQAAMPAERSMSCQPMQGAKRAFDARVNIWHCVPHQAWPAHSFHEQDG